MASFRNVTIEVPEGSWIEFMMFDIDKSLNIVLLAILHDQVEHDAHIELTWRPRPNLYRQHTIGQFYLREGRGLRYAPAGMTLVQQRLLPYEEIRIIKYLDTVCTVFNGRFAKRR